MNSPAHTGRVQYAELAQHSQAYVSRLPMETIITRFQSLMQEQLRVIQPHRAAMGAMLAARIGSGDDVHLNPQTQQQMQNVFVTVVYDARDTLPEKQQDSMGTVLYTLHLLILFFWLIDRTEDHRATTLLLDFTTEAFKLLRPMLIMPLAGASLDKLATILRLVFSPDAA